MCLWIIVPEKILGSLSTLVPNVICLDYVPNNDQLIRLLLDPSHFRLRNLVLANGFDKRPTNYRPIENFHLRIF